MTADTALFNVPTRIFPWLSVTRRTLFQYQDSNLSLLMVLWCLHNLADEADIVKAGPRRILRLLLLLHSFDVDALLVSTLLI